MTAPKGQYRFHLPSSCLRDNVVTFPREVSRQLRTVLRLEAGAEVTVFDNTGIEYLVGLTGVGAEAQGKILASHRAETEPGIKVHLYQASLRAKKLELVVQKCTEIGVSSITIVKSRRSVADLPAGERIRRLELIAREGAEQSGRAILPLIDSHEDFNSLISSAPGERLICTSSEGRPISHDHPGEVSLLIGPEGGFEPDEVNMAVANGWQAVSLGRTTLRAETAAIVASALVLLSGGTS